MRYLRTVLLVALIGTVAVAGEAPVREGKAVRDVKVGEYVVRLDLSGQVVRVSVPEDRDYGARREVVDAPILPTLAAADTGTLASAAVLAAKAKAFDDGLYAAAELAAEPAKAGLLASLAGALRQAGTSPALDVLFAGARLANSGQPLTAEQSASALARTQEFLADPLRSKPIGFYTWSEDLARIFRQDRMLQTELVGQAGIRAIVQALAADEKAFQAYQRALALAERLTNPLAGPDLRSLVEACRAGPFDVPEGGVAFFPPSRAPETDLVMRLYGDRPIPEGFDLADEVVKGIRDGSLSLAPTEADGWYAHQLFSLEPLAVPEKAAEATRLSFDDPYRQMLVQLLRGILALTRETHVKQLEIPAPGAALPEVVLEISPRLRAEPLATHYFRRADAYAFVQKVLTDGFGTQGLEAMRRRSPAGASERDLSAELAEMESLFRGASATVMEDLGLAPFQTEGAGADAAVFARWAASCAQDPDVGADLRCMVPVFHDRGRQQTKVWVFLGWSERPITVSYATPPKVVTVLGPDGQPVAATPRIEFESDFARVLYPVTAEVYVTRILDRVEFRRLCDRLRTQKAILAQLK